MGTGPGRERHWCSARRGAMAGMFGKKEKKEEDLDPELGPTIKMDVPSTFQGWCTLISRVLAPAEELSPFKLGQIQKLIADINADAGLWVAPYFVTGQILFLVAFALYLVTAILAIVVDFGAAEDACAEKSWVWLYVLLAVAIPTGLGFVMGMVKQGLMLANLKKRVGWEVPPALLSFPGPVLYVVLGILGILLWAQMESMRQHICVHVRPALHCIHDSGHHVWHRGHLWWHHDLHTDSRVHQQPKSRGPRPDRFEEDTRRC